MPTVVRVLVYEYADDEIMREDMSRWQFPTNGKLTDIVGLGLVRKKQITSFLGDTDGGKHTIQTHEGQITVLVVKESE